MVITILFFTSINMSAINSKLISSEKELQEESCFSFIHEIYHEYLGGINLDNMGYFLEVVEYCEAMLD